MTSEGTQDSIGDLEHSYLGGAKDDKTVRSLDRLYTRNGQWHKAASLYEETADARGNWKEKIWYLKRACSRFNRIKHWESFIRCHRKAVALVPSNVSPQMKLNVWCPAGLVLAYVHTGAAGEVLSQLDELEDASEGDWSVYGRFLFHFARSLIYRELGEWDGVIDEGKRFVEWAEVLSKDDQEFLRLAPSIDEEEDPVLAGESGRCYCICTSLTEAIALGEMKQGYDSSDTIDALNKWLAIYLKFYRESQQRSEADPGDYRLKEAAEIYGHRVSTCYGKAAVTAFEVGRPKEALQYFASSEKLRGKIEGEWQYYRAATFLALGRLSEGKRYLSQIAGPVTTNGLGLETFGRIREFDEIREDPDVVRLVGKWKKAEAND